MKKQALRYSMVLLIFALSTNIGYSQDGSSTASEKEEQGEKIRFNGLGRTNLLQTGIDGNLLEGDTLTPRSLTDGEFLLDLKINATPNDKTEVQTILRLRNEFGGFFGSGMTIEVRELWARGVIANRVKYRVGDMDMKLSKYTLYNYDEEGHVNQPAAFMPQKEIIYYEQFYGTDNTRRLQGANLNFGLQFTDVIRDMEFTGFIARVRGTDFFTIPSRFVSGGELQFSTYSLNDSLKTKADFGFYLAHTFDDLKSGEANTGIRNTVATFNWDLKIWDLKNTALHFMGETGQSWLVSKNDSVDFYSSDDSFLDLGASLHLKPQKVHVDASFLDVGPEFFSIGAQSKRIEYDATKKYYNRAGEAQDQRSPTLFDITRDPAIYTFQLSDKLMPYDPRFSNTFPYGRATPNRRGITVGADYGKNTDKLEARLDAAIMSEIRGQGTTELKNFTLLKAAATIHIDKYIDWEKNLRFTLGYQYELTDRGGLDVEKVNLSSNLLELGIEAEIFTDFEVLLGAKLLQAEGSDYIPRIDNFNIVSDFPGRSIIDDTETLLAGGVRYNFKEGIYITLQYHAFSSDNNLNSQQSYNLNQIFVLYTMNF
ncbi:hypothetical protein G3O08_04175 [Cryomorpha ignava]|uniref:Uncharacterized protein n=1 Tax=Cryomorpha ignava TaxID=101383 RepID=A0A7K3WNV5_9FLAO|nr:hypothetical protein [Cryomorpha ignava]NEN22701.1 hypothetical protein [Cryomorpha ignava]